MQMNNIVTVVEKQIYRQHGNRLGDSFIRPGVRTMLKLFSMTNSTVVTSNNLITPRTSKLQC